MKLEVKLIWVIIFWARNIKVEKCDQIPECILSFMTVIAFTHAPADSTQEI